MTDLVNASELSIAAEVLLIEGLESGVKKSGQERVLSLLDDLGAGLASVVLSHHRRQPVGKTMVGLLDLCQSLLYIEQHGRPLNFLRG